ncbi:hypothetical protein EZV62_004132 [Acer yangbiense]|uniref:NB-ARC domain-containing protein n=1 Tax=Acer yangbiense TaxID=1000413 RepID=A0A5C7IIK9_9ROSI|nr:hypothetical protein EZV62_004132 [Acer yangbiense]
MGNACLFSVSCDVVFSRCLDCTIRRATYICELQDNLASLNIELQNLIRLRVGVIGKINLAEQRHMKRTNQVQGWLQSCCSNNCKSSYNFGKQVAKKLQVVATSKREGKDFEDDVKVKLGFDVVIWTVVSKEFKLEKIQKDIGKKIGFSNEQWKKKTLQEKAQNILKILSQKRFVLLLDDIWERVDLKEVGVPIPGPNTTSKVMLDSNPNIVELAKRVSEECGGLPLVIKTIAQATVCNTTLEEWNYAIHVLKRSPIEYAKINQGYSIINTLLRACLLEEEANDYVKIHDVIRDMNLYIACEIEKENENFLVCANVGITKAVGARKWEGVTRISFMDNEIGNLPEALRCPSLITLIPATVGEEQIRELGSFDYGGMRERGIFYIDDDGFAYTTDDDDDDDEYEEESLPRVSVSGQGSAGDEEKRRRVERGFQIVQGC